MLEVSVTRLDPEVPLPSYAHPGDAGCDLVTTVDAEVPPGERVVLPTGIALALPAGYAAFVHPRSGLAAQHGVGIVNSPGTIDAGYRGEVKVILVNHDRVQAVRLRRLDRVAQLVVQRVEQVTWHETVELPDSRRGAGGHGSTGGHSAGQTSAGQTSAGQTSAGQTSAGQTSVGGQISVAGQTEGG